MLEDFLDQVALHAKASKKPGATRRTAPQPNIDPDTLNLGIDLGGDTLKIAFAYYDGSEVRCGKLAPSENVLQIAVPALAFYDSQSKKWFFADQLDTRSSESFVTVVKIKSLLSLLGKPQPPKAITGRERASLSPKKLEKLTLEKKSEWERKLAVWEKNKECFRSGNHFPRFYFPIKGDWSDNFSEMIEAERTFVAEGSTPYSVCVDFFSYAYYSFLASKKILEGSIGREFENVRIALVHPAKVGDDYINELSGIIERTFYQKPDKIMNTNKALAQYAFHRGAVRGGEQFLVFDMGEESMSVIGASIVSSQVAIDGADGHSDPVDIGGNDIDNAIVGYLEDRINARETIGTPCDGSDGHIYEESVYSKQYLLMKDIKNAKTVFSKPILPHSSFNRGVPVTFSREIDVEYRMTKDDISRAIGIKGNKGIARKIAKYVIDETKLSVNRRVKKIFISGGLIETYGLLEYLRGELKKECPALSIFTFDDGVERGDRFSILSHEDSVYAPAVGGAIVALKNIEIKTVLSLSYGTWLWDRSAGIKCLSIFANRGDALTGEITKFFTNSAFRLNKNGVDGDEVFCTPFTEREIRERCAESGIRVTANGADVGEPKSPQRAKLEGQINLYHPPGCENALILIKHKGRFVYILDDGTDSCIQAREGFLVDKNGRARFFVENVTDEFDPKRYVRVKYYNTLNPYDVQGLLPAEPIIRVLASELEPHLVGYEDIDTTS